MAIAPLLLLLLLALPPPAAGDPPKPESPPESPSGVRYGRLAALAATGAALDYAAFKYFDRAWYVGEKQDHIRWIHDWYGDAYLDLDKGAHFMGGLVMAESLGDAFRWSGFGERSAALLGTAVSWAALLQIEMRDAYFREWGFSVPDFFYNTLGAGMPLVYSLVPGARAVGFKFSYFPSPLYRDHDKRLAAGRPRTEFVIDDYEGMTFWVTLALDRVLRGRARALWPDYLGLALGYGATGLHGSNVKSKGPFKEYKDLPDARPEFFLSLDYDLRFLPGEGGLLDSLKRHLNYLHLPAPAVRFYPDWRFYLLYM